jgi:metal-dependent hydrolase (beta-lactamase superfamily II)
MKLIINEQFINHVSNTHCSNINQKSYMENHSHAKQEVVYCGRQEQYFLQDAQQSF